MRETHSKREDRTPINLGDYSMQIVEDQEDDRVVYPSIPADNVYVSTRLRMLSRSLVGGSNA